MEKETLNNFYGFLFVISFKWDGLCSIHKYVLGSRGHSLGQKMSLLDVFFNVLHALCSDCVVNLLNAKFAII